MPFPTDVPRLKELGVRGVITLNESYETLVPTSLYEVRSVNSSDYYAFFETSILCYYGPDYVFPSC